MHFIDVNGIRTRYYENGAGEPLLLLHGGGFGASYSLDSWSLALPGLVESFHVFALDRLGQGFTDNPGRLDDYRFEAVLQHVLDFIQAVGLSEPVHVVGHSRGGLVVGHLALKRADLLKTVTIVDSQTLSGPEPSFYRNLPRLPGPPSRESVRIEPDAQSFSQAHVTEDYIDRMLEIARLPRIVEVQEANAKIGARFNDSLVEARAWAHEQIDARGIPVPTLIIWGQNDVSADIRTYGYPLFDRIAATTARAELHVINQTGHYVMREQPEAFIRSLRSFCLDRP